MLEMKYFVLKPAGNTPHAAASRWAMVAYAKEIESYDKELSVSLLGWVDKEQYCKPPADQGSKASQATNSSSPKYLCYNCRRNKTCNPHNNYGVYAGRCDKYAQRSGTSGN